MTEDSPPTPPTWRDLQEQLKNANADRSEFLELKDLPPGQPLYLALEDEPVLDKAQFHGKYSILELEVTHRGQRRRLCVSGARLAAAIAGVMPKMGDVVIVTPHGQPGRERKWSCELQAAPRTVATALA